MFAFQIETLIIHPIMRKLIKTIAFVSITLCSCTPTRYLRVMGEPLRPENPTYTVSSMDSVEMSIQFSCQTDDFWVFQTTFINHTERPIPINPKDFYVYGFTNMTETKQAQLIWSIQPNDFVPYLNQKVSNAAQIANNRTGLFLLLDLILLVSETEQAKRIKDKNEKNYVESENHANRTTRRQHFEENQAERTAKNRSDAEFAQFLRLKLLQADSLQPHDMKTGLIIFPKLTNFKRLDFHFWVEERDLKAEYQLR
jgi:hypothetical protein